MSTSIEQLKSAKHTWEFKAPDFKNGVELIVELREPSLSTMIFDGTITNPLINEVSKITGEKTEDKKKPDAKQTASVFKFMNKVVQYCMVSPTYDEVREYVDGGLSEAQLIAIYEEVMRSTKDLTSFREEQADT